LLINLHHTLLFDYLGRIAAKMPAYKWNLLVDNTGSEGDLTGKKGELTGSEGELTGSEGDLTGSEGDEMLCRPRATRPPAPKRFNNFKNFKNVREAKLRLGDSPQAQGVKFLHDLYPGQPEKKENRFSGLPCGSKHQIWICNTPI
jgi:hypothetical protein